MAQDGLHSGLGVHLELKGVVCVPGAAALLPLTLGCAGGSWVGAEAICIACAAQRAQRYLGPPPAAW